MTTCHHCSVPAEVQWPRHATDAEAAAHFDAVEGNIRESGNPDYVHDRTGQVRKPVYACGDHTIPMPCTHTDPVPAPCPACHAAPGSPCISLDGGQRPIEHRERVAAQPQPDVCTHAHAADCGGYGACQCATKDTPTAPKAQSRTRTKAKP